MYDSAAMRFVQRIGNLHAVLEHLLQRQRAFLQPLRQRLPFDALHHQVTDAVLATNIVQHADVRMIQARDGFGFSFEPLPAYRISGKLLRQNLDRHRAIEPRI